MASDSDDFEDKWDTKKRRKEKDKLDDNTKRDEKKKGIVCRDFMRNLCDRGSACKFDHPGVPLQMFSFCHDFQNGYCRRSKKCRFIHASYADEKHYLRTGELPSHLLNCYNKQQQTSPDDSAVPYCKKFFSGECWGKDCSLKHVALNEYRKLTERSPSPQGKHEGENNLFSRQGALYCKQYLSGGDCWNENCCYRHLTRREYHKIEGRSPTPMNDNREESNLFERRDIDNFGEKIANFRDDYYEPEVKRPFVSMSERMENGNGFDRNLPFQSRPQPERSYMMLEEENMMLRERVSELRKRIDDLQVTNEFLLDQNARLRLQQEKNATGLTAMTVPAVTITNGVAGANQMQPNPTPQQMVTAALRTVTASVATVPVSIATVTPVSISAVSMAPVQPMPPSVMTIAQQGAPPAETQIAPQPLPMSISAPSVPLVSYPIMSRTVMQQSAPPPPNLRH